MQIQNQIFEHQIRTGDWSKTLTPTFSLVSACQEAIALGFDPTKYTIERMVTVQVERNGQINNARLWEEYPDLLVIAACELVMTEQRMITTEQYWDGQRNDALNRALGLLRITPGLTTDEIIHHLSIPRQRVNLSRWLATDKRFYHRIRPIGTPLCTQWRTQQYASVYHWFVKK